MEYGDHTFPRLLKEPGVRGYSRNRKAELIAMLRDSEPPPQIQTWEPMRSQLQNSRTRGLQHTRPPHPMRPPPPSPLPSVKFRPDRPRQPELLRQLEERNPQLFRIQDQNSLLPLNHIS